MTTERPRARSRCPSEEAVRPLPREETTPPVTKICRLVGRLFWFLELFLCTTEFDPNSERELDVVP
ncbi:hypothetical protein GCM10009650_13290 [Nesterenkonia jeotgali]